MIVTNNPDENVWSLFLTLLHISRKKDQLRYSKRLEQMIKINKIFHHITLKLRTWTFHKYRTKPDQHNYSFSKENQTIDQSLIRTVDNSIYLTIYQLEPFTLTNPAFRCKINETSLLFPFNLPSLLPSPHSAPISPLPLLIFFSFYFGNIARRFLLIERFQMFDELLLLSSLEFPSWYFIVQPL